MRRGSSRAGRDSDHPPSHHASLSRAGLKQQRAISRQSASNGTLNIDVGHESAGDSGHTAAESAFFACSPAWRAGVPARTATRLASRISPDLRRAGRPALRARTPALHTALMRSRHRPMERMSASSPSSADTPPDLRRKSISASSPSAAKRSSSRWRREASYLR